MRVLVLGGTGLTGPYVVRRLARIGHDVTVFHRGRHEAEMPAGVRRIHGDLGSPPTELGRLRPDVVIHMMALTEADAMHFLDLFATTAGRAIVISSCDVYRAFGCLHRHESGQPDPVPLAEDAPLRESRYPYRNKTLPDTDTQNYDKILVERALLSQNLLPVTILRYPAVYGPRDPHSRFRSWLQQMAAGNEIAVQEDYARWRWTHGYVEDAAEAVVLAATSERAAGRIYNVGEARTPTALARLEELARVIGWSGRFVVAPAVDLPEAQRLPHDFTHHVAIDSARIRSELGYEETVSPDEAWRRTVEWERAQAPTS